MNCTGLEKDGNLKFLTSWQSLPQNKASKLGTFFGTLGILQTRYYYSKSKKTTQSHYYPYHLRKVLRCIQITIFAIQMYSTLKPQDVFNFNYCVGISYIEGLIQALNFCPVTQISHHILFNYDENQL